MSEDVRMHRTGRKQTNEVERLPRLADAALLHVGVANR